MRWLQRFTAGRIIQIKGNPVLERQRKPFILEFRQEQSIQRQFVRQAIHQQKTARFDRAGQFGQCLSGDFSQLISHGRFAGSFGAWIKFGIDHHRPLAFGFESGKSFECRIGKRCPHGRGANGSWFLVLGSWFLVLGAWCLVLGSWKILIPKYKSP